MIIESRANQKSNHPKELDQLFIKMLNLATLITKTYLNINHYGITGKLGTLYYIQFFHSILFCRNIMIIIL